MDTLSPSPDQQTTIVLPIQQKVFAFTTGLTAAEFLAATPGLAKLVYQRYQEVRIPPPVQDYFVNYPDQLNFALLLSEEAPETPIVLPIWMRIAQLSPRFALRIFRDTDNLNLLNQLLEEIDLNEELGELELPLCFLLDEEWNQQSQWGPHAQAAEPYFDQWFEQHSEYETLADDEAPEAQRRYAGLINDLIYQMRVWYNSELDRATLQEIRDLFATLREEEETESNGEEER
ncbi:MAG: hypothetical protein DYG89_35580 [Caldilinea sp. CFX5]|nr:hypothetical protein [Caldilinea sp. CFX5]